jgi:hypothetical protein
MVKTAFVWGPISSFSGPLISLLLNKGWHVHVACKSAFNLLGMSPLDLPSAAQSALEKSLGGHEQFRTFSERLRFFAPGEIDKNTDYNALIFCPLPPNFDEARAPRAPWAAGELGNVAKLLRGVPAFLVSSIWGGVQNDYVVPEEIEFSRRKPQSQWENVCQQYEIRLLHEIGGLETNWHLVRLPLLTGSTATGAVQNFSGLPGFLQAVTEVERHPEAGRVFKLNFNPDSTLWFMPVDSAVQIFSQVIEDGYPPRVLNLVSPQTLLNQEWVESLGLALNYPKAESAVADPYRLPSIVRHLLLDEVQVSTRNLFELLGRYQITPAAIDKTYFEKQIRYGRTNNWGHSFPVDKKRLEPTFSEEFAHHYFEEFMPIAFGSELLEEATKGEISIGFIVDGPKQLAWVLRSTNGQATVDRLDHGAIRPKVSLHFSTNVLMRLILQKTTLEKAMMLREVRTDGPMIDALRVASVFGRVLKEYPYYGRKVEAEALR